MSNIHFVATKKYADRVIQLGENPQRVFNVGGLGIDNINNIRLLSKDKLQNSDEEEVKDNGFEVKDIE